MMDHLMQSAFLAKLRKWQEQLNHQTTYTFCVTTRIDADMKQNEKIDVREIRRKLGMNQSQFWSKIGVTQSGGSRYESGRAIPRPVQALLRLVHIEQIDVAKLKREDVEVSEFLKESNPELFKSLKKDARAKKK